MVAIVYRFYIRRVWICTLHSLVRDPQPSSQCSTVSDRNKYLAAFIAFFMFSIFGFALLFTAFCWMFPTWLVLKMHISTAVRLRHPPPNPCPPLIA